jgi:hypothetical protein
MILKASLIVGIALVVLYVIASLLPARLERIRFSRLVFVTVLCLAGVVVALGGYKVLVVIWATVVAFVALLSS